MMMMQAAATLSSGQNALEASLVSTRVGSQKVAPLQPRVTFPMPQSRRFFLVRAEGEKPNTYVDYEGKTSVFPAEACEETGENCAAEGVFKEIQPTASAASPPTEQKDGPDREYESYTGEKTVFPGEACEELGGEFCEPDFQKGVFPEKVQASKN